jgi:small subunit ribosomal protein S11
MAKRIKTLSNNFVSKPFKHVPHNKIPTYHNQQMRLCGKIKPNNAFFAITNLKGQIVHKGVISTGRVGDLQGHRKKTFVGTEDTATAAAMIVASRKINLLHLRMKGVGKRRRAVKRSFRRNRLRFLSFYDTTPMNFNGCRKKKPGRD